MRASTGAQARDGLGRTAEGLVDELDAILRERRVACVYQPIVDLETGAVVAYEALARGPRESPLERPEHLFEASRRAGRLAELDWLCRSAAALGAVSAGLRAPWSLFVNVEPGALHRPVPQELREGWLRASGRLRMVFEITERALALDPTALLWDVGWARDLGFGIALDKVGSDARARALLAFLRPDVVKLDLGLLHGKSPGARAAIVHAVAAEAERTGAMVVAVGIESDAHLETARAAAATLGQGWLLGHPRPLPTPLPQLAVSGGTGEPASSVPLGFTPFDMLRERRTVQRTTKAVMCAMSRSLEHEALALREPPVVIATFGDERFFSGVSRDLYTCLGRSCAFVAAAGSGMSPAPAPGVRGVRLSSHDPLRAEWLVVVQGSQFSAALAARDLADEGADRDRRFDYVLTYERDLVTDVARSFLARAMTA
jgi:EAL domain-containing protein (putative c-di-GMP-specific phosphodiesterase class I)